MVPYYGDFPTSHTAVTIPFGTFAASTGAPTATTNFAAADVVIYKNGGTTQRTSANGITVTTSFDSATGMQMIVIDLSDNTDAGFYAAGAEYQVQVGPITADGQTLTFWAGCFSIERAGGVLALIKGNAIKVDVNTIKTNPVVNGGTITFPTNATLASTTNITAGTIATVTTLTNLPTIPNNWLTAAGIAADVTTELQSGLATASALATAQTSLDDIPTNAELATALASADDAVLSAIDALPTAVENADAFLDRDMSTGADNGSTTVRTPRQALRAIRNKVAISGGTMTVHKENDSTASWTAALTTDAAAEPITAIDPAGP